MNKSEQKTCIFCVKVTDTVWLFFMQYVRYLMDEGFTVKLIAGAGNHKDDLTNAGIEVMEVPFGFTLNPLMVHSLIKDTRKILESESPELLIVSDPTASFIGRVAAAKAGVSPVIYYCQGLPFAPHSPAIENLFFYTLEKYASKFTDHYIVVNSHDREACRSKFGAEPFWINSAGVNTERFRPAHVGESAELKKQFGIPQERFVAAFFGRLIHSKGIMEYLEAARILSENHPGKLTFLIGGGGPLEGKVRAFIQKHKLEDSVNFLGYVRRMAELYRCIDVMILPTYYKEGLPVTITEAMSSGAAVIASDVRGCHDIINDGENGILIPYKSPGHIVKNFERLYGDRELHQRLAKTGMDHVRQEYNYARVTEQFAGIIQAAISSGFKKESIKSRRAISG